MAKRLLDKEEKQTLKREIKWEWPGWVLTILSTLVVISGIWYNIKPIIALGLFMLILSAYIAIMGRIARKKLFKR